MPEILQQLLIASIILVAGLTAFSCSQRLRNTSEFNERFESIKEQIENGKVPFARNRKIIIRDLEDDYVCRVSARLLKNKIDELWRLHNHIQVQTN